MKHVGFVALLAIALGMIAWAFSTTGKEGMFVFCLGSAILLCTLAVVGLRGLGSQVAAGHVLEYVEGTAADQRVGAAALTVEVFWPS